MDITVKAKFIKTTPRKLRLVASGLKHKKAVEAAEILRFINKAAAGPMLKALNSALAIVRERSLQEEKFYLQQINCDQGPKLKRRVYRSRGRATAIEKKMSHLSITLSDEQFIEKTKNKSEKGREIKKTEIKKSKIEK